MTARNNSRQLVNRIAKSFFAVALAAMAMFGSVGCDEKQLLDFARDLVNGGLLDDGSGQPPSPTPPIDDPSDSGFGWDDWGSGDNSDCGCF